MGALVTVEDRAGIALVRVDRPPANALDPGPSTAEQRAGVVRRRACEGSGPMFDAPMFDAPMLDAPMLDAPMLDAPMLDAWVSPEATDRSPR